MFNGKQNSQTPIKGFNVNCVLAPIRLIQLVIKLILHGTACVCFDLNLKCLQKCHKEVITISWNTKWTWWL